MATFLITGGLTLSELSELKEYTSECSESLLLIKKVSEVSFVALVEFNCQISVESDSSSGSE